MKIAIIGAESTGKTTLAARLAFHFHAPWVPEYGRIYTEVRIPGEWTSEEFIHIAQTQMEWENALGRGPRWPLFCDTDTLTTAIFHEVYLGTRNERLEAWGQNFYDLTFLMGLGNGFRQDGMRHDEEWQLRMHERFLDQIDYEKRRVIELHGSWDQRYQAAKATVIASIGKEATDE